MHKVEEQVQKVFVNAKLPTSEKLCHFFWLQPNDGTLTKLTGPQYFSLASFMAHHGDWKIILWTNCLFVGDLIEELKGNGLIIQNIERGLIPNFQKTISDEVDWLKWAALWRFGGMIMDISDTVTLHNMDDMWNAAKYLTWSWYGDKSFEWVACGWLLINHPGCPVAFRILNENTKLTKEEDMWFEVYGGHIVRSSKEVSPMVDPFVVFGAHPLVIVQDLAKNVLNRVHLDVARIVHLYAGNVSQMPLRVAFRHWMNSAADPINWPEKDNAYCNLFKLSMKNAHENNRNSL